MPRISRSLTLGAVVSTILLAQQQAATPAAGLNVAQAVNAALQNYPSIRISQEQMDAAAAGIRLARTAYLPRVDTLAQVNRSTRNNVFGLLFPQNVIPSISGPVIGSNNFGTAWGSAVGTLVTWEPFDFGLRQAGVSAATAAQTHAAATVARTQYDVAVEAADSFVTLLAAQETIRAAQAGVDRADVILRTTTAQVNAQLRPGADQSRAEAELAAARTELIQAQQAADIARVNLSQFTGIDPAQISITAPRMLQLPAEQAVAPLDPARNPIAKEQNAAIDQLKAELKILERSYFPRFFAQASAYARGTGAELNGGRLGGANGLAPSVQDYATGFTVTFPVMDFASIRAREAAQSATIRAETARYRQIAVDLRARWNTAVATLQGARRIAANTPVQVLAAQAATNQASARYQSGLGNIDEVAEAQRLLTQAEIDDALARLNVWRGLLGIAAAAGDIQPFVTEASQ
jgi:outer membrane protein TolC